MKTFSILPQIFIFVTLSLCITLQAQTVSNEFKNTINNAFAGLDLNRVPHHLLTDYAMEFVNLESYNGVLTDNNYVHKGIYTAGYNTLLMARTRPNVNGLVHPDQFHANWEATRQPYTIALSGFYYKYSRIRENAHPNSITVSNNKLYDKFINGVWQNPYKTESTFMMTSPTVMYNYKNMNVVLPTNLWYTNQSAQVQNIAVNFNDGNGFINMTMGQQHYLEYNQEGTYDWEYRLTLSNGIILKSRSKIIVGDETAPISTGITLKRLITEPCVPRFQPNTTYVNGFDQIEFQGTTLFDGMANNAIIQIDYADDSDGCPGITRPLIVAEGFESGLLGGENPLGENSLRKFRNNARDASLDLRGEIDQYDIIYINWNQGRDDLRRNAALLQDIINWVNETKTTAAQNVVLGQSMGGVIARYTLASMEQDNDPNTNHDTSLYISHDAPHQGANIPLGIQYFARHLTDQFVSTPLGDMDLPAAQGSVTLEQINEVFNSTGTKQLLANNISSSFSLNNTEFESWQTELQNLGYPQQTKNIAISNASHCANDQLLSAQDELLFLSGNFGPTVFGDFLINNVPLLSGVTRLAESALYVYLALTLNNPAYLAGLLPGRTNFNLRFEAKALPAIGQSSNIYKGRIRVTKKINFLLFDLTYNINITNREYNNPSQVSLPLDSYPGGFYPVTFNLSDANENQSNWFFQLNVTGRNANSFNFIPTPSALDVGSGSSPLVAIDYKKRYNSEMSPLGFNAIPFDNFTTSFDFLGINEAHISFNTRNGDWLAVELDNIFGNEDTFNCTWSCDGSEAITGPGLICDSSNFTFQNGPTSISWSLTPSNAGSISINILNPNQITVTRSNSYNGPATINANASSPKCGSNTIPKNVWFGGPNVNQPTSVSGPNNLDPGQTGLFSINTNNFNNASSFTWVLFSNQFPNASQHFELNQVHDGLFTVKPDFDVPGGYYSVQARATNACGFYPVSKTFYVEEGDGIPVLFRTSNIYKIYPNPSSTTFNISLVDKTQQPLDSENIYGELLDLNGLFMSRIDINDNKASVNANNLRKGVYILRIYYDGKSEGHQVIVE